MRGVGGEWLTGKREMHLSLCGCGCGRHYATVMQQGGAGRCAGGCRHSTTAPCAASRMPPITISGHLGSSQPERLQVRRLDRRAAPDAQPGRRVAVGACTHCSILSHEPTLAHRRRVARVRRCRSRRPFARAAFGTLRRRHCPSALRSAPWSEREGVGGRGRGRGREGEGGGGREWGISAGSRRDLGGISPSS